MAHERRGSASARNSRERGDTARRKPRQRNQRDLRRGTQPHADQPHADQPHADQPHADQPHAASPAAQHSSPLEQVVASGQEGLRHAVSEVAHERRPRGLVVRYGRAWLAGYALVVAVVVVLAFAAHAFSILPGDLPIARELQENRTPIVFWAMYAVSYIGYEPQAAIIFALAMVGLWIVRLRLEAVFLVLSELADVIANVVKIVVARSRPSASLVDVVTHLSSYSFPSGHTVHYTVFYGFLGFVIATNFRAHWPRQAWLAVCVALIVLVGPSRVYLGEHWPTDVLGGYLIGGLFLVPLIAAYLWAKEHVVILSHWPFVRRRATSVGRDLSPP